MDMTLVLSVTTLGKMLVLQMVQKRAAQLVDRWVFQMVGLLALSLENQ